MIGGAAEFDNQVEQRRSTLIRWPGPLQHVSTSELALQEGEPLTVLLRQEYFCHLDFNVRNMRGSHPARDAHWAASVSI